MMKIIFNSFSQGFFKTIGRVSAWVVLALILYYLYENGYINEMVG